MRFSMTLRQLSSPRGGGAGAGAAVSATKVLKKRDLFRLLLLSILFFSLVYNITYARQEVRDDKAVEKQRGNMDNPKQWVQVEKKNNNDDGLRPTVRAVGDDLDDDDNSEEDDDSEEDKGDGDDGTKSTAQTSEKSHDATVTIQHKQQQQQQQQQQDIGDKTYDGPPIRKWGCDLTETPLIFVHNGKSGGGNIRARMAASAQNYTRGSHTWQKPHRDEHYYPIRDNDGDGDGDGDDDDTDTESFRRGKFCNSQYPHYIEMPHIDVPLVKSTFEGVKPCNATTPLGIAVACPHPYKADGRGKRGGIAYRHYGNNNCGACDDDYYLDTDYYFPPANVRGTIGGNSTSTALLEEEQPPSQPQQGRRRLTENLTKQQKQLARKKRKANKDNKEKNNESNKEEKKRKKPKKDPLDVPVSFVPTFEDAVLDPSNDPPPGSTCDVVFTAHNNMGSELNWLPPRYLKNHWWDNMVLTLSSTDQEPTSQQKESLEQYWDALLDDRQRRRNKLRARAGGSESNTATIDGENETDTAHRWCPNGYTDWITDTTKYDRPTTSSAYKGAYEDCSRPLAARADAAFVETFFSSSSETQQQQQQQSKNYSPFYASMPLHRVTVMRDPWSWIVSKFFWHNINSQLANTTSIPDGTLSCSVVTAPTKTKGGKGFPVDPITGRELGWCEQMAIVFLIKLCGNDCRVRYENGMMNLDDIEAQVASNLRNAFSVVGILHEEESFYDMLTDRIQYVDLRLHKRVQGGDHATKKTLENLECKKLFGTDEGFRESVRQSVPAFAALERMYRLGIAVNKFQKEELRQCKLAKGETPTRGVYKLDE
jgi:hypothetical protein